MLHGPAYLSYLLHIGKQFKQNEVRKKSHQFLNVLAELQFLKSNVTCR